MLNNDIKLESRARYDIILKKELEVVESCDKSDRESEKEISALEWVVVKTCPGMQAGDFSATGKPI